MIRAARLGRVWYAMEVYDLRDDLENIEGFLDGGDVVILADSIEEIEDIIDDYVVMVEPDNDD